MAGPESGVGVAGSSFTHYAYPGIYQNQVSVRAQPCLSPRIYVIRQDFHHCGLTPNDVIVDWDNRVEVLTCQLEGLAEYVSSCCARFG
jgi:hypothetical protein